MLRQALLHVIVFAAIKAQHCLDEQVCLRNASQFILLPKHSVEESCGLIFIVSVDLTDLHEITPIECLKLLPCCILADLLVCWFFDPVMPQRSASRSPMHTEFQSARGRPVSAQGAFRVPPGLDLPLQHPHPHSGRDNVASAMVSLARHLEGLMSQHGACSRLRTFDFPESGQVDEIGVENLFSCPSGSSAGSMRKARAHACRLEGKTYPFQSTPCQVEREGSEKRPSCSGREN